MRRIDDSGKPAFQGDVMFRRIDRLPDGAIEKAVPSAGTVVAHSETGHHHIATGGDHAFFVDPKDPMHGFIVARGTVEITHHRSTDTHETFELYSERPEVVWEITRQREYVPEGWRRVED